ncbi:NmrA family NAD(P)-binding protein [Pseudactinotalea sp. Z1739]|uniref:NmrA family NAD(P)-binding protein n=1 Tax=Pseudactinotalea sp. Z1739 TaxID=3413028 RepID=UPI003C7E38D5
MQSTQRTEGHTMYVISGATGRVGSAIADRLLENGSPVRVLVRRPASAQHWVDRGAEAVLVDLADQAGLTGALQGAAGFFTLLPFNPMTTDFRGYMTALISSITEAVVDARVPHVALLSSVGAHLPEGTGPIAPLHHLENALRSTTATVTAVRPVHFQEKITDVLDAAREQGIYPVFAGSADVPVPMVATRDVGAVLAEALLSPPRRSETIALTGPAYREREIAEILARLLDRELEVMTLPRAAWKDTILAAGVSAEAAQMLVELHEAGDTGRLVPHGDRTVHGTTGIEQTLAGLVAVPI